MEKERESGLALRSQVAIYSAAEKAEFLLSNAIDAEDYAAAMVEVKKLGIDLAKIPSARRTELP